VGLIVIGAIIGALVGGVPGLLIGGFIGYGAGVVFRRSIVGGLRVVQSQLIDSVFAVMGALCKADKVVTRDEINAVEQIFGMLGLHGQQREARISRGRGPLLQLFLQLQCMAIAADGRIDAAEHAMLVRIARRLGLSEADVSQLEALLRAGAGGPSAADSKPAQDRLADAYVALGVTAETNAAEIKRAYRKLISQNHPDKLAARGLPESMRAVAEERSREINSAYDLIKSARSDLK
jgi:DnaJ like chaperone protein